MEKYAKIVYFMENCMVYNPLEIFKRSQKYAYFNELKYSAAIDLK